MTEQTDKESDDESREKREQRARVIGVDVRDISLVDRAANEREFLAVKKLDGGADMNAEASKEPTTTETEVEKAFDLSKQLMNEQGDGIVALVNRMKGGDVSREDRSLLWDAVHEFNSNAWVHRAAKAEGKAAQPGDYPLPKIKEADAEKADASIKKAQELLGKARKMASDNKDLVAVLDEIKDLLAKIAKYPYPDKKNEEGAVTTKTEKQDAKADDKVEDKTTEKQDAKAGDAGKTEETDAEKRTASVKKLLGDLTAQRKSLDETIKRVEGIAGGNADGKNSEKAEEENKALKALVEKQGKDLDELRKSVDGIVKTRGTSKGAGEPDEAATEEQRAKKGEDAFWNGVL